MVRAHVAALGGNAVVSYSMKECVFMENPNKNQVRNAGTTTKKQPNFVMKSAIKYEKDPNKKKKIAFIYKPFVLSQTFSNYP